LTSKSISVIGDFCLPSSDLRLKRKKRTTATKTKSNRIPKSVPTETATTGNVLEVGFMVSEGEGFEVVGINVGDAAVVVRVAVDVGWVGVVVGRGA